MNKQKRNTTVANYDSLRCCQCDNGRQQNEKHKQTNEQTEQSIWCKQPTQRGKQRRGNFKDLWGELHGEWGWTEVHWENVMVAGSCATWLKTHKLAMVGRGGELGGGGGVGSVNSDPWGYGLCRFGSQGGDVRFRYIRPIRADRCAVWILWSWGYRGQLRPN